MNSPFRLTSLFLVLAASIQAQVPNSPTDVEGPFEPGSNVAPFESFRIVRAPDPGTHLLRKGDRLAIIGDSITEQKMYSRIMETYLTVCAPQLEVTVRQVGWSGETAAGFARRMESDCLRFAPTIATFCYGMNDHRYRPYDPENGQWYRDNYTRVVQAFKDAGVRVVLGSPGSVGRVPTWTKSEDYSLQELNLNLATLRNIDVAIAREEGVRFADVFWPMLRLDHEARQQYGNDYAVPGKDGVHPGWAGQLVMAYCFLKAMGLDGEIGRIDLDLASNTAHGSDGHEILGFSDGRISVRSSRYPYCASGAVDKDDSIRSGMSLVPFNEELNRFILKVSGAVAGRYRITWGEHSKLFGAVELSAGINLAKEFQVNPFSAAFERVDNAVFEKQQYETRQIKVMFHGPEMRADPAAVVSLTENVRQPLSDAIANRFVSVEHTLRIEAE
jgi:lysophospholipase L1-like esterase